MTENRIDLLFIKNRKTRQSVFCRVFLLYGVIHISAVYIRMIICKCCPSLLLAWIVPPCSEIMLFAIDRPIPEPPVDEFLEASVL